MYGAVDFYTACKDAGIHPVIGSEVYICPDMDDKKAFSREYSHLVLLCENNEGYQNLTRLVSEGYTRGFYYKPRIDYRLLRQHSGGLIALSACLSGDLPKLLLEGRYEEARDHALGRLARATIIEIMDHGIMEESGAADQAIGKTGIPLWPPTTATTCSGTTPPPRKCSCVSRRQDPDDSNRMRMDADEFFVKSEAVQALFPDLQDAVERSHATPRAAR